MGEPDWEKLLTMYRALDFRTLLRKHEGKGTPAMPLPPTSKSDRKSVDVRHCRNTKEDEAGLRKISEDVVGVLAVEQPRDLFGATLSAIIVSDGTHSAVLLNPDAKRVAALGDWLNRAKRVVAHDLKRLMHSTGWKPKTRVDDTMIGSYLLHSGSRAHDICSCAFEHLQIRVAELPASCSTTGECDAYGKAASLLPRLFETMRAKLTETGMTRVYEEIEMPLLPVLFDAEVAGIELDTKALNRFAKDLRTRLEELTAEIRGHAGGEVNINSPSQLAEVLFEKLKLPTKGVKKTQKGFSTAAPELEKLADAHPIIPLISEYRELEKLRSTYAESLPGLVREDGRVHTTYNQTIAATGRLSSVDPNLQNIPIKTELGNKIREAFVAGRGKTLIAADYSQIELRLVAVLAKDQAFIDAFRDGADIHTRTASEVWEIPESKVTSDQRRAAKAINFGIIYGMGARSLARSTKMGFTEAQEFIDRYFSIHHAVRTYLDATKAQAHTLGYVESFFGRRRYLPEIATGVPMLVAQAERMAINMPVQGTAADVIKLAMIAVDHWLKKSGWPARLLLQVHDELVVECDPKAVDAVAKGMKDLMQSVANFDVPLAVDVEVGQNWGDMKEWKPNI
jgi:DNA polymerase-1